MNLFTLNLRKTNIRIFAYDMVCRLQTGNACRTKKNGRKNVRKWNRKRMRSLAFTKSELFVYFKRKPPTLLLILQDCYLPLLRRETQKGFRQVISSFLPLPISNIFTQTPCLTSVLPPEFCNRRKRNR